MQILLNGQPFQAPDGATVLELLQTLQVKPDRVAVEVDGLILKKPEWGARVLAPGARLEIVHFVGGG